MWIPKALSNSGLSIQPDGQVHFYPYGVITKGFIIDDPQRRSKIENHWKVIWVLTFAVVAAVVLVPDLLVKGLVLAVYASAFVVWIAILTRGLPRTQTRRKMGEVYGEVAGAYPLWALYAFLGSSCLFAAGSGFLLVSGDYVIGGLGLAFFGLGALVMAYMTALKKDSPNQTRTPPNPS